MTDEEADAIQAEGNRRVEPYLPMLHTRIRQIMEAMYISMSDLTIVFPEADWEGVEEKYRPATLFGCRVVLADVPTAMVAAPAPAGRVAYATLAADIEGVGGTVSGWERSRWLQMLDGDGRLWMETSSPSEVRAQVQQHPDWPVFRLYQCGEEYERRPITLEELEADCVAEDEWYRRALGGSNP